MPDSYDDPAPAGIVPSTWVCPECGEGFTAPAGHEAAFAAAMDEHRAEHAELDRAQTCEGDR